MPCTQENRCSIYTELSHYTFVTSFKRNVMYTNILKNENENIVRTLNTLCPVKPQCLECHTSGLHLVLIQGLKKVPSCWASNFSSSQVTSHQPYGQGIRQRCLPMMSCHGQICPRQVQFQRQLRATCSKGKLEFFFFFSSPAHPHETALRFCKERQQTFAVVMDPSSMKLAF